VVFLLPYLLSLFDNGFLSPKSEPEFKEGEDFITSTPVIVRDQCQEFITNNAYYIRVKVTNKKRRVTQGCRAYLVNIEKEQNKGGFNPTSYCDSIQLAWSNSGEHAYDDIDISKGVNQFVDIIATNSDIDYFEPQIRVKPYRYESLFREIGVFRFTIQISAENADPKIIKLIFKWSGDWSDFEVTEDN